MSYLSLLKQNWLETPRKEKLTKAVYFFISCCIALAAVLMFVIAMTVSSKHAELDSYALPMVSIQHRGSIIMTPDDLISAKQDFPDLYENVNTFDDLRSSKLIKIDETHWLSYYFPVYSVLCMPAQWLLRLVGAPASKCFDLTNAVVTAAALFCVWRYVSKRDKAHIMLPALLAVSPFLLYINFRSAEAVMGALMVIAMVCRREGHRKSAALIISITCTMQPVIMAVGIVIFIDYLITEFKADRKCYKNIRTKKEMLLLCCCYIPSLVPFIVNKVLLGTWSVTAGMIGKTYGEDTVLGRFLEYFLDLNLGIASFAFPVVFLFIAAYIYSIVKRDRTIFIECTAALFLTVLISFAANINCGMVSCARYVVWIYPVVVFPVHEFIVQAFSEKKLIHWAVSAFCILYTMVMFIYNGLYPIYSFNSFSSDILDRVPQLYVTFCDSTFNSKANGIHGGYDLMEQGGYAVYYDSDLGEVRKILYVNTESVKTELINNFTSEQDPDMSLFAAGLKNEDDNRQYYICVSRYEKVQYVPKQTAD